MVDQQDRANQLSQAVEQQVRQLIGDLQMQCIVLRQMLELAQPKPGEPRQVPGEQPVNPNPAQPPGVKPGIEPNQNPPGSPFPPRNPADIPEDRPANAKGNGSLSRGV